MRGFCNRCGPPLTFKFKFVLLCHYLFCHYLAQYDTALYGAILNKLVVVYSVDSTPVTKATHLKDKAHPDSGLFNYYNTNLTNISGAR